MKENESLFKEIPDIENKIAEFLPKHPINLLMLCAYTDYYCGDGFFGQVKNFAATDEGRRYFENSDNWDNWKKEGVYNTVNFARSLEQTFCDWLDYILPEDYAVNSTVLLNVARLICYFDSEHRFSLRFPLVKLSTLDYFKALTGFMNKKVSCIFTHWLFRDSYHKHFSLVNDIVSLSARNDFHKVINEEQAGNFIFNQLPHIPDWRQNYYYDRFANMLAKLYGFKLPSENLLPKDMDEEKEEFTFFPYGMIIKQKNSRMQAKYGLYASVNETEITGKILKTQLNCLEFPSFEAHHGIYRDDEEQEYLGIEIISKQEITVHSINFDSMTQKNATLVFFPLLAGKEKGLLTIEYRQGGEDYLEEYEISAISCLSAKNMK